MPLSALQNRYTHISPLGVGGFGEVYRAEQVSTGQLVAIKRLKVDLRASQSDVGRFARELRIVAGLSHPNIVRLLDTGVIPGDAGDERYLVFEFVPGLTLAQHLTTHGPLTLSEATRLMAQVLDALACAHAAGVVHRDVKPQNIMLAQSGLRVNAQLLDFGIAAVCEGQRDANYDVLTRDGEAPGTLCYSAPEQIRGQGMHPQVDLFAWGLVFVEALTGERVVSGRLQSDVLRTLLGPTPIALPEHLRDQPIAAVLAKALAKDPAERFATAQEAYTALQSCAQNVPPRTAAPEPIAEPIVDAIKGSVASSIAEAMTDAMGVEADPGALVEAVYDSANAIATPPEPSELGRRRRPRAAVAVSLSLGLVVAAVGLFYWFAEPEPTNVMRIGGVPDRARRAPASSVVAATPVTVAPSMAATAPASTPMRVHRTAVQAAVDRAAYADAAAVVRSAWADARLERAPFDAWLKTEARLAPLRAHPAWRSLFAPTVAKVRRPRRKPAPPSAAPRSSASEPPLSAPATDADWKRFH